MNIDNNETEKRAMAEFHKGNRKEGLRIQEEFASAFRTEYAQKDHCPCRKACRYHGNCKECVAIHRAHQEHVPNCMRPMINKKNQASVRTHRTHIRSDYQRVSRSRRTVGKCGFKIFRSSSRFCTASLSWLSGS